MTKQEKIQAVEELTETFRQYPNFYITETGGLTVAQVNNLRGKCHAKGVKMQVAKNTLIRKALESLEGDYSEVIDNLKLQSAVMFATGEEVNTPAKVIKAFREGSKKPVLKVAYIEESVYVGDEAVETLAKLKSKTELIGEVIGLLQSPAKNVISALQSGGGKLAGIVKTLSERSE